MNMIETLLGWMSPVEFAAAAFGLASVWLTVRRSIWCWPTGLIMVLLYIYIFFEVKLYSDMGLQVVYVFLQLYGWHHWIHGGADQDEELQVGRLTSIRLAMWLGAGAAGIGGLGFVMATYTDASLAYWDAATTVLSLIAQWLMIKKVVESWGFWIAVDLLAVGVYLTKGLYLTAGLYLVFLGLAFAGLLAWAKNYREIVEAKRAQKSAAPAA
jgi:nicotinamide mononucleotide transporter